MEISRRHTGSTSDDLPDLIASLPSTQSVTYNLTNGASASINPSKVISGQGFSTRLKAPTGYALAGVQVTMGGVDITSQVLTYASSIEPSGTLEMNISSNGTTTEDVSSYANVEVNVAVPTPTPSLQTKTISFTPTTSSQSRTVTADSGYDGLSSVAVSVGAIPSQYVVPSGTKTITENGTGIDVASYASVNVDVPSSGGMNVQMYNDYDYSTSTSYSATDVSLTVSVTGTYDISWVGWRNTTSGTSGSQLYKNGSAYGSAVTTFRGSYGQSVNLSNVSLSAGDVLVVRARARSSSYKMYVANLVIVQTS